MDYKVTEMTLRDSTSELIEVSIGGMKHSVPGGYNLPTIDVTIQCHNLDAGDLISLETLEAALKYNPDVNEYLRELGLPTLDQIIRKHYPENLL